MTTTASGLMTPRYVIDEREPCTVIDRWEESGEGAGYVCDTPEDAVQQAREMEDRSGHSMLIVYSSDKRGTEIRPVVPIELKFHREGTEHYPVQPDWYLKAYALDRGRPGEEGMKEAIRHFKLEQIKAWDV